MRKRVIKYNPAFLSKEELVRSFVVRHAELDLILQVLHDNVTKSNQHVLVIGARGTGKTMLTLRVAEGIRRKKDLNKHWYPLVFSEESYQVTTPGEFWLEALFHLGQKTGDLRWKQTHRELSNEQDEVRLRERALTQLMDFAGSQRKRILLIVENFNMLLGEQMSNDDGWALRHTLLNEPRIMLLATATSRFKEVDNSDNPMFELFRTLELNPLDEKDCRKIWTSVTGKEPNDSRIRPLQILTGGNPRLLTIVSTFAVRMSLKELMNDLMQLVDEHTEYFKSHLDNLPAIERKVYLGLAELWKPSTAREVTKIARLDVNKTSSLLRRLMKRGSVVLANGQKRTKLYQVSERMYNIYYLMRRRGSPSRRVKALIRFMVSFYEQEQLLSLTKRIAEEACKLQPELRQEHFFAYEALIEDISTQSLRERLIKATPHDFFEIPDIPSSIRKFAEFEKPRKAKEKRDNKKLEDLLKKADDFKKAGEFKEAEDAYRKAVEIYPNKAIAWIYLGLLLQEKPEHYEEVEKTYRKAIDIDPEIALAWALLGLFLHEKLERYDEAEKAYRKAIELQPDVAVGHFELGQLLHEKLERYDEAEKAYRKAIELRPEGTEAWMQFGQLLHEKLERYDEAEKAYRKAIELQPDVAWGYFKLGQLLHEKFERYDEAEKVYRKAIELEPDVAWGYFKLGQLLNEKFERYDEAEKAYRKAIELEPNVVRGHFVLGQLLHEKLERYDEAEISYRKAIELDKKYVLAWAYLGLLLFVKPERHDEAEKILHQVIEIDPTASSWVLPLLGELCMSNPKRYGEAEKAYRKAIEFEPEDLTNMKNLILVLQKLGRWEEASNLLKKYFEKTNEVKKDIEIATELVIGLAISGAGKETLEILRESPSAKILEPLVVGLQLYVGEDVKAAAEIMEVAKDVVKKIEQRRDELKKRTKSSD